MSMISKSNQVLHRFPTTNLRLNSLCPQLEADRLLRIPCLCSRYWRPSLYTRLALVDRARCYLRPNTHWLREFRSAFAVAVSAFTIRTSYQSARSTRLPRTRFRRLCVFFCVFLTHCATVSRWIITNIFSLMCQMNEWNNHDTSQKVPSFVIGSYIPWKISTIEKLKRL